MPLPHCYSRVFHSLLAAIAITSVWGCSHFDERYQYRNDHSDHHPLHTILADHDGDGVKDYGDLCAHSPALAQVNDYGCALNQPGHVEGPPLAEGETCPFAHHRY